MKYRTILIPLLAAVVAGCGGGGSHESAPQPQPGPDAGARYNADDAASQAKHWLATWCHVKTGWTPRRVQALMGKPTDVAINGNRREDIWHSSDVGMSAVYINGKVEGLTIVTGNVPCDEYRVAP